MSIYDLLNNNDEVLKTGGEKIVETSSDEPGEESSSSHQTIRPYYGKTPAILGITHANLTFNDLLQEQ